MFLFYRLLIDCLGEKETTSFSKLAPVRKTKRKDAATYFFYCLGKRIAHLLMTSFRFPFFILHSLFKVDSEYQLLRPDIIITFTIASFSPEFWISL